MADEIKSFKEIPQLPREPAKPLVNREKIQLYKGKVKETVVNSQDIKWKPVDKVAAMVVMPASWDCQPPEPEPVFEMKNENDKLPKDKPPLVKSYTRVDERGVVGHDYMKMEECAPLAVDEHKHTVKEGIRGTEELIEKSRDLIAAIDYLASEMRGPWAEYQEFVKQALGTVREQRLALGSETRLLMGALREVRQFFLEADYEKQIARLHEFTDLCERLKALKESGFVDAISDTILKL